MRFIYSDEAGTGPAEPACVVVGVIVHADEELRHLVAELDRITAHHVPANIADKFHIHGKEIFNGGKLIKREEWPLDDRLDFMKEILCLPLANDIPIAVGVAHKGIDWKRDIGKYTNGLSNNQFDHWMAFTQCMERADYFLRKFLNGAEVGAIVAEDIPEMRSFLSQVGLIRREIFLPPIPTIQSRIDKALGRQPHPLDGRIEHIVDVPHFVKKGGAPLIQIADVCAFAFRRQLFRQPHGDDLIYAMLGPQSGREFIEDEAWYSGLSGGLFNTAKYMTHADKMKSARDLFSARQNMANDQM